MTHARVHARSTGPRSCAVHHHERGDPAGGDQLSAFNGESERHGAAQGMADHDRAPQVELLDDRGCVVDQPGEAVGRRDGR